MHILKEQAWISSIENGEKWDKERNMFIMDSENMKFKFQGQSGKQEGIMSVALCNKLKPCNGDFIDVEYEVYPSSMKNEKGFSKSVFRVGQVIGFKKLTVQASSS